MTVHLALDNCHVSYGAIKALKGVSLHVNQGEIVTLIGCNGAGKTTLLHALSGLIPMDKGQLTYNSKSINKLEPHERVKAGLVQVPEGRMIFQNLTVEENISLGSYLRRDSIRDDYEEVLQLFPRLKERLKQLSGTLSGGEQQMLAIARALMGRPDCLLLDEPSLGLAPALVQSIFEKLLEIHSKRKLSILLVEQDAMLALKTANRGYVLENGEIRLEGKSSDLLRNDDVKKAYLGID